MGRVEEYKRRTASRPAWGFEDALSLPSLLPGVHYFPTAFVFSLSNSLPSFLVSVCVFLCLVSCFPTFQRARLRRDERANLSILGSGILRTRVSMSGWMRRISLRGLVFFLLFPKFLRWCLQFWRRTNVNSISGVQ